MSRFFRDCDFLAQVTKVSFPPPPKSIKPCKFSLRRITLAILFWMENNIPTLVAGDGDVCDRKTAIAVAILVLSGSSSLSEDLLLKDFG